MKRFVLAVVLALGLGVFAALPASAVSETREAEIAYREIKIVIDGQEICPRDAAGNEVEPFILDGTTYLPVRAVADALAPGDVLEFICDYYGYGGEYLDSYLIGEPLTVTDVELEISNVPLDGEVSAVYRFTDLFNQQYWSLPMAAE